MSARSKAFFSAVLILAGAAAAGPQSDPVSAIQKLYAQTQTAIELALKAEKEGVGAGLYATEILVNSHKAPWRAVGNYANKTTFWFTDQPEFAVNENLPPEGVLAKIDVKIEAAARRENEEFLFDRGRLVFYFHRIKYGDDPAQEMRFYFQDGHPLRAMSGTQVVADVSGAADVKKRADALVKLFLETF